MRDGPLRQLTGPPEGLHASRVIEVIQKGFDEVGMVEGGIRSTVLEMVIVIDDRVINIGRHLVPVVIANAVFDAGVTEQKLGSLLHCGRTGFRQAVWRRAVSGGLKEERRPGGVRR